MSEVDLTLAVTAIVSEYRRAAAAHSPMHSAHEGYAVLQEGVDELWDEVKQRRPDRAAMVTEAVQVGAMALRFLVDVCYEA